MINFRTFLMAFLLSSSLAATGQQYMVNVPVTQQDARVQVTLMYQEKNNAFGMMTQDYRITVQNRTSDKLKVYIDYGADLTCGTRKTHQIGPLADGITIAPGQTVGKPYSTDGSGTAVRLTESACPKDSWKTMGKDKSGSQLYSMISSVWYHIVKIENISEKDRAAAEAKKQQQKEEAQKRQEAAKSQAQEKAKTAGIKSGAEKPATAAVPRSAATSASQAAGALSEKVKVNGEYVQVYRSNGVPYVMRADGSIHQTTESAYSQISEASAAAQTQQQARAQQEKAVEEQRKAQAAQMVTKLENERRQQEEYNRQLDAAVTNVTGIIGQAIQSDAEERERRYQRDQRRREERDAEANAIAGQYQARAEQGEELAIKQMIRAQYLMSYGNPVEYMKNKRSQFGSQEATEGLRSHFQHIISTTDEERGSKFLTGILYLAGGAGAYFLFDSLAAGEESSGSTEIETKDIYTALAYGVGGTGALVGVIQLIGGLTARGTEYRQAQKELEALKNKQEIGFDFAPAMFRHDDRKAFGVALRFTF